MNNQESKYHQVSLNLGFSLAKLPTLLELRVSENKAAWKGSSGIQEMKM